MTAEIAIMNRQGVALAADSAVSIATSGNTKIYNTNKLFMLSKYRPVGVMVYGNADLMTVPWETIIKIYRSEIKDAPCKNLREYGSNFLTFLNNNPYLFPAVAQENHVYGSSLIMFSRVKRKIDEKVEQATHKGLPKVSVSEIEGIVNETIKADLDIIDRYPRLTTLPANFEKAILSKYLKIIDQAIDDIFHKHALSTQARKQLRRISIGLFVKDLFGARDTSGRELVPSSGLVVAGFGENDLYPSLVTYELEGVVNDTVKYKEVAERNIGPNLSAILIPFAQREMVLGFMDSVTPDYKQALYTSLSELFDKYPEAVVKRLKNLTAKAKKDLLSELKQDGKDSLKTFWDGLNVWAKRYSSDPVVETVDVLPIAELATMAESLVNLTSFKRRMTLKVAETVGGPIDVAVISKGDGFIWIKRKHYFEGSVNPHFLKNYYR